MTKFSVLGATGMIGSKLAADLARRGHEVFEPGHGTEELFANPLGHVIYCIGVTADFRSRPYETLESHVTLLADLLKRGQFDSLLYLSSTRVYSGAEDGLEDMAIRINPHDASDFYNLTKLMGESLCHVSQREHVRVARLSNVVGADRDDSPNFIPSLIREARNGHIQLYSSLTSAKDYVHIDDVVSLLPKIAVLGRYDVYNVASGRQISHSEWVERLRVSTGCGVSVTMDAPQLGFAPISIARIVEEFGFVPRDVFHAMDMQDQ